jgi:DNA invertase Pin-like site-specific DNA recombinase
VAGVWEFTFTRLSLALSGRSNRFGGHHEDESYRLLSFQRGQQRSRGQPAQAAEDVPSLHAQERHEDRRRICRLHRSSDGFDFMLRELKRTETKVVIVAEADTLARNPIEREAIILKLKSLGVRVVTVAGDDLTNDPAKAPMREAALRYGHAEAVAAALRTLKMVGIGHEMAAARRASARPTVSGDRAAVAA